MARLYHGPLQPGKRSAYVKGSRKNSRRKGRTPGRLLPSRARFSRSRLALTTAVSRVLQNNAESKFKGFEVECSEPVAIPAAVQPISYHFFNTGKSLAATLPEFTPLDMFRFAQGDGNAERIGNSMYIKNGMIHMNIQTLPKTELATISGDQPLIEFRLMMVKANRKFNPLGEFPDPGESLFLTPGNNSFGYDDTQATHNFKLQPINKRKWLVYCDKRFTLSYPVVDQRFPLGADSGQVNNAFSKYPTTKTVRLRLPVMKKTHFNDQSSHPDNLDTQWLICLQAMHPSFCMPQSRRPNNYRVNMNCTTIAQDL